MRVPIIRLVALTAGFAFLMSCESGPTVSKFGGGIGGGPSNQPAPPPDPNTADTEPPFVRILTPTENEQFNIGDEILVTVRIQDDRKVGGLSITGFKESGDRDLGTFTRTVRYTTIIAPGEGGVPLAPGQTDATFRRFLRPALPLDETAGVLVIDVVGLDSAGNSFTAQRRVNLVSGPRVTITVDSPEAPIGLSFPVRVRAQQADGVNSITLLAEGAPDWQPPFRFETTATFNQPNRTDVLLEADIPVPATAPFPSQIRITATAVDVNRNVGIAPPVTVTTRGSGTIAPRVRQTVPDRVEITDSISVVAEGDGIVRMGLIVTDADGNVVSNRDTTFDGSRGTQPAKIPLGLGSQHQGKVVRIISFATDVQGRTGFSIPVGATVPVEVEASAFANSPLVVFGTTYPLPRSGTVGDIAVDPLRGHVFVSNLESNRLDVWKNDGRKFDELGVAVGSQPWGLNVALDPNVLLVANSGGTNISRVNIGSNDVRQISEDLPQRILTRGNYIWVVREIISQGRLTLQVDPPILFSDRPQYLGQITDGRIFFSTRPTPTAPEGIVRYLDPSQPFPDLRTLIFTRSLNNAGVNNYVIVDVDSVLVRPAIGGGIDTLVIFDHTPGTDQPSGVARAPCCFGDPIGVQTVGPGVGAAIQAIQNLNGSDVGFYINAVPVGLTDTTFVALSGNRDWIAFGQGNSNPGFMTLQAPCSAVPNGCVPANNPDGFRSPLITQFDLTNNASERIFGLAIDNTGETIAAHGVESYFSSIQLPFHMRLQGKYSAATGGAGIAFHPNADGRGSAEDERLSFVAAGDRSIHIVDIAYFIRRGKLDLKNQLYGPLRATLPLPQDNPPGTAADDIIVLKLYGIAPEGLVVIDLRASNIEQVP